MAIINPKRVMYCCHFSSMIKIYLHLKHETQCSDMYYYCLSVKNLHQLQECHSESDLDLSDLPSGAHTKSKKFTQQELI